MIPVIDDILHSSLNYFFIDTENPQKLHNVLIGLGFKTKQDTINQGNLYTTDSPHQDECIDILVKPRTFEVQKKEGTQEEFSAGYMLWHTCYSRRRDCDLGVQIAQALLDNDIRTAVLDNKYTHNVYYFLE